MKKIKLSNKVVVSDPCYEIPTWCQIIVDDVLPGYYQPSICRIDLDDWGNRISGLSCVHEDYIGKENELKLNWVEHPGIVGVDSGQAGVFSMESYRNDAMVGEEPVFDFGDSFDREMGDVWYRMCAHKTLSEKSWGVYDEGVVSSSGIGDGSYDLYVLKNNEDKVVGFCIDFLLDENFDLEFYLNPSLCEV
jgi:Protein of unknown function (DUF4241)